jgi:curved DNA-binding protein CbpA
MDNKNIDPYKVIGVKKNFTIEELRNKFKKIVMIHHPDKGGDPELFKLFSLCYKKLFQEYKLKQMDKQFSELKLNSTQFIEEQTQNNYQNTNLKYDDKNASQFSKNFNETFDKFKVSTVYDQGYGNKMISHNDVREEIDIQNNIGKYNSKKFNNQFEKQTMNTSQKIIKYSNPEPLISMKALGFAELGLSEINDFSGDNETLKKLNYTDYMKAYTTTRLVDPKTVSNREKFKTIDDIKAHREKITYEMSEEDIIKEEKKKLLQKKAEEKRLQYLREQDHLYNKNYEQANQAMLKFR